MSVIPPVEHKAQPQTAALFVSDIHLSPQMPKTAAAFHRFLDTHARHTRALYLLGDIFEYWAGDDDIDDPFNQRIVDALHSLSEGGVAVFWIAGNRDFLAGEGFAHATGATLLQELFVADIGGQRVLLLHGDAQCTDDRDYMAFRAQVRNPEWQRAFLARPLAERKAIIESMREGSRDAQRGKAMAIMDVNASEIGTLFERQRVNLMIHGHTHRPAVHEGSTGIRHVLPDWDCDSAGTARGGWIAIDLEGHLSRHTIA